jgi:hypothetical protein
MTKTIKRTCNTPLWLSNGWHNNNKWYLFHILIICMIEILFYIIYSIGLNIGLHIYLFNNYNIIILIHFNTYNIYRIIIDLNLY